MDVLADVQRAEFAHAGHSLEEKDTLDQDLGVAHLTDGLQLDERPEFAVAPVVAHLGVDDVLVDGRELTLEYTVEVVDNLWIPLHVSSIGDSVQAQMAGLRVQKLECSRDEIGPPKSHDRIQAMGSAGSRLGPIWATSLEWNSLDSVRPTLRLDVPGLAKTLRSEIGRLHGCARLEAHSARTVPKRCPML